MSHMCSRASYERGQTRVDYIVCGNIMAQCQMLDSPVSQNFGHNKERKFFKDKFSTYLTKATW